MTNLTLAEKGLIPLITEKAKKLSEKEQAFILGWMSAKVDSNVEKVKDEQR